MPKSKAGLVLKMLRFASLFLTALAMGGAFGHLLELPNKLALDHTDYLFIQQHLYQGWGRVLGPVEYGSLASSLAVLFLVRKRRPEFYSTLAGAILLGVALLVWQVWVGPVNQQVDTRTAASMPADWATMRDHWEYGHAARAGLFAGAFAFLLVAALTGQSREPAPDPVQEV